MNTIITSIDNPTVRQIIKLQQKKHRKSLQQYVGQGMRICKTIIERGGELQQLIATPDMLATAQHLCPKHKLVTLVNDKVMEKISSTITPSGILGVFSIPAHPPINQLSSGIVLAEISDPGNMGTLIRTSAAMDRPTVVIIEGVDPWSPKVVQASAGSIAGVNIFQLSWPMLIKHKQNIALVGLVVSGGISVDAITHTQVLLVIGNEAHGIRPEWIAQADQTLTLPMPGNTESLNAAVAGSIALYLLQSKTAETSL